MFYNSTKSEPCTSQGQTVCAEKCKFNINSTHMELPQDCVSLSIQLFALSFYVQIIGQIISDCKAWQSHIIIAYGVST